MAAIGNGSGLPPGFELVPEEGEPAAGSVRAPTPVQPLPASPAQAGLPPGFELVQEEGLPPGMEVVPEEERPTGVLGAFQSGVKRGFKRDVALYKGATGLALSALGVDSGDALLERAARQAEAAGVEAPAAVENLEDVGGIHDFALWAADRLGESVPTVLTLVASGGIAGIAGRIAAKQLVKGATKQQIQKQIEKKAVAGGIFGSATVAETGATATELRTATGETHVVPSVVAGVAKGALDTILPLALSKTLGLGEVAGRGFFKQMEKALTGTGIGRLAKAGGAGMAVEGATELVQEAIDIAARNYVDENYEALGPEASSRLLNAAASGMFLGGTYATGASLIGGRVALQEAPTLEAVREMVQPQVPTPAAEVVGGQQEATAAGPVQMMGVAPIEGGEQTFKTAKGSIYTVHEDGTTTRVKAQRAEHGADQGLKDRSAITLYVDPAEVGRLGLPTGSQWRVDVNGDKASVVTWNEATKKWGIAPSQRDIPVSRTPAAGLTPLELWNPEAAPTGRPFYKKAHFGNAITELSQRPVGLHTRAANQNSATPGSDPRDAALGFEVLPQEYADIPARNLPDLTRAPVELAIRRASELEHSLKQKGELAKAQRGLQQKGVRRAQIEEPATLERRANRTALRFLVQAAAETGKGRIPTIWAAPKGVPALVVGAGDTVDLGLPPGYTVRPAGNTAQFLNVVSPKGRPILQVPNAEGFEPVIRMVAKADLDLDTSTFYQKAAGNIAKFDAVEEPEGRFLDTNVLKLGGGWQIQGLKPLKAMLTSPVVAANWNPANRPREKFVADALSVFEASNVRFNKVMEWWNTLQQIAWKNPGYAPLQALVDVIQTGQAIKMRVMSRADSLVKELGRLGSEQLRHLAEFAWAMERQDYQGQAERNAKGDVQQDRQPSPEEVLALAQKHGLVKESLRIYHEMVRHQSEVFDQHMKYLTQQALVMTKPKARVEAFTAIQKAKENYAGRPRLQLRQFGDFHISVYREGKLVYMDSFESAADQKRAMVKARETFTEDGGFDIRTGKTPAAVKTWSGVPDLDIRKLARTGMLRGTSKEQLEQIVYWANANRPMMRRELANADPRKFADWVDRNRLRQGALDVQRSYAQWAVRTGNALDRMVSGPQLQNLLIQMKHDVRLGESTNKLGQMVEYLEEFVEDHLNPKDDFALARAMAFNWWLAFVPSSAVLNLTQLPLVTYPYLAARFGKIGVGDVRAFRAIQKATTGVQSYYSKGKLESMDDFTSKALSYGIETGKLEESQATEVAGLAEGTNVMRAMSSNKIERVVKEFAFYGSYLFQGAEKFNRRIAFRAALDLAMRYPETGYLTELEQTNPGVFARIRNLGMNPQEARATLAAIDVVDRTDFEYSKWNRPKFMKGKVLGTLTTFWMFTQNILHFSRNAPGAGRFWLIMAGTAGLMGLPGGEDLMDLLKLAGRHLFGVDFDLEKEIRWWVQNGLNPLIRETTGENWELNADLLLHGWGRESFGLATFADAVGVPWIPKVDVSTSLSMGRISPIPISAGNMLFGEMDYNKAVAQTTERMAGAALGPVFAILHALGDSSLPAEDFKRWEKALPRSVRSLLRAGRLQAEGEERTRSDGRVLEFDPNDPAAQAELWLMAGGFHPTRLQRKWDMVIAAREKAEYFNVRRKALLEQLDYVATRGYKNGRQDVLKAIRRYNEGLPDYAKAKAITGDTIRKSLKERARRRALENQGVATQKSDRGIYRETEKLYPEVSRVR